MVKKPHAFLHYFNRTDISIMRGNGEVEQYDWRIVLWHRGDTHNWCAQIIRNDIAIRQQES